MLAYPILVDVEGDGKRLRWFAGYRLQDGTIQLVRKVSEPVIRWAIEWRSKNRLDGERRFFMWDGLVPRLFLTRKQAREHVRTWAWILDCPDLRREPHGWKMPRPVKVEVILRAAR